MGSAGPLCGVPEKLIHAAGCRPSCEYQMLPAGILGARSADGGQRINAIGQHVLPHLPVSLILPDHHQIHFRDISHNLFPQ